MKNEYEGAYKHHISFKWYAGQPQPVHVYFESPRDAPDLYDGEINEAIERFTILANSKLLRNKRKKVVISEVKIIE